MQYAHHLRKRKGISKLLQKNKHPMTVEANPDFQTVQYANSSVNQQNQ